MRRIKAKSGRIYEYGERSELGFGKRRPYQHHPDFKYKENPKGETRISHTFKGIRKSCLIRDNFTCQICHKPSNFPNDNYKDLCIHHKDGNGYGKTYIPDNSLDNLITLCFPCHLQLHYDTLEKHKSIVALRNEGFTLKAIGDKFGVSRQRIEQILKAEREQFRQ